MGDQYLKYLNQCLDEQPHQNDVTRLLEELVNCIQNQAKRGSRNVVEHILKRTVNYQFRDDNAPPSKPEDDLLWLVHAIEFRRYDPSKDPPPAGRESAARDAASRKAESLRRRGQVRIKQGSYDYEERLQSILSEKPELLEEGLRLHPSGYEYYTPVGRIDLLCIDRSGGVVIIECKGGLSTDQAAGQLLRYIGWFEENPIQLGQAVRGIIVGRRIHEWLRLATRGDPRVELFEYILDSQAAVPRFNRVK